jgi:putative ABC transport system permease protein
MTLHLLKLIWNRRRSNLLVMTEIFFSFVVLLFVVGVAVYYADNYRRPLGYRYDDVWRIEIGSNTIGPNPTDAAAAETGRQLLLATHDFPQIAAAAIAFTGPYDSATWSTDYDVDGRHYAYELDPVTDGFEQLLGLQLVRGRFFSREDDGAAVAPVVVNERLARSFYPDEDPVGRLVPQDRDREGRPRPRKRIVGVVREFRQHGEFVAPAGYMFERRDPVTSTEGPRLLLVRVRPGTTAEFEETLMRRLQSVARDWSFKVESLSLRRSADHRQRLGALLAVGLVAGFLMLMVALGLTGVLWQNVTQRTREIGLRRAKGATARRIYTQIVGEIVMMTTLSVALAVLLVAQLPFLGVFRGVPPHVFVVSLVVSVAALYALAVLCGLHPARLAMRVQPAEALHYE